jgi:hypothetical protein
VDAAGLTLFLLFTSFGMTCCVVWWWFICRLSDVLLTEDCVHFAEHLLNVAAMPPAAAMFLPGGLP